MRRIVRWCAITQCFVVCDVALSRSASCCVGSCYHGVRQLVWYCFIAHCVVLCTIVLSRNASYCVDCAITQCVVGPPIVWRHAIIQLMLTHLLHAHLTIINYYDHPLYINHITQYSWPTDSPQSFTFSTILTHEQCTRN